MAPTYNFLRTVSQKLKQENSHPLFLPIILVLVCIPLAYIVNSNALAIFVLATLLTFQKKNARLDWVLLLPIALYALMALSLLWTIDMEESSRAISKELSLLIIPGCFLLFPIIPSETRIKIIRYFSIAMVVYSVFYLFCAIVRYAISGDTGVFFYHELVTKDVNAIHVSVYVAVAFFYFLSVARKSVFTIAYMVVLLVFLVLLSSKIIIGVFVMLVAIYFLFNARVSGKNKWLGIGILAIVILSLALIPKVRERFAIEFQTAANDSTINNEIGDGGVRNISIRQAWNNTDFTPNDYFSGTPFRVYQLRIFFEMMAEDNAWLTGYGLNASYAKIEKKTLSNNLFAGDEKTPGYQKKNFHNQYIQNFAELGILGFVLLLAMLAVNLKNGLKRKDFVHISFAVLMISLFLTESFLWRQRGVTFFAMMFCLLNAGSGHRKE